MEAFKSTLEVVGESDLLVHVVDASAPDPTGQIDAVRVVLAEIGAADVPELLVWNKVDRPEAKVDHLLAAHPGSVAISAFTGEGLDGLLEAVGDRLRAMAEITELLVPYERGDVLASVHREGEVLSEVHGDDGIRLRARLERASQGKLAEFVVAGTS